MKRWILALLVLLVGLIGLAHADYVIIIANLGLVKAKEDPQGQQQPGMVGMRMMGAQGQGMMGARKR